ncbi:MAG: ABC transporter ATP-binding protein [Desulfobacterales bacterium]|nr:ABC transporter ATP-binding protein [Desulfobacterales bacterium]MBL7172634.1 ABC transporter ATP-binding protein [Desulfobacteraceae bacterium]MBU0732728.1 ABC transporter ATP-binding protein [Pseudomonadota bacterium]
MLKLEGVHAYYGTSHILHGIDLSIEQGETVTLLGRNGAGKTTTMRTIMGLLRPKEGQVIFRGEVISGHKPFQIARKGIAYVPEERAIFVHLSLVENLKIAQVGMGNNLKGTWTVERIFEKFPTLAERKMHRGANLSGGEQQMLAIARALMSEPDLLLLDEPSEGLAPLIVEELQKVTREIVEEGITVLLVEQDLDMCTALARRHYVMDQGRIVYCGTNEEFMANEEVRNRYLTLSSVERTLAAEE